MCHAKKSQPFESRPSGDGRFANRRAVTWGLLDVDRFPLGKRPSARNLTECMRHGQVRIERHYKKKIKIKCRIPGRLSRRKEQSWPQISCPGPKQPFTSTVAYPRNGHHLCQPGTDSCGPWPGLARVSESTCHGRHFPSLRIATFLLFSIPCPVCTYPERLNIGLDWRWRWHACVTKTGII